MKVKMAFSHMTCLFPLMLISSVFVDMAKSEITLTADPRATDGRLCPEVITFKCTTLDVPGLGTAVRWFFNGNDTIQFQFVYFPGLTYPYEVENGTFILVADSAALTSDKTSVNAVVRLVVDASVLDSMGIWQVHCGRTLNTVIRTINITGLDKDAPQPLLQSLTALYSYSGLQRIVLILSSKVYPTPFCTYKMSTDVTISTLADGLVFNTYTFALCSEESCPFTTSNVSTNSTTNMIQVTMTNSLGLSSNTSTYDVPTQSFKLTFNFDNTSCELVVQCEDISSQSRVRTCEIFNATSSTYDDLTSLNNSGYAKLIRVEDKTYYFEARSGSSTSMVTLQRMYTVTGTESCEETSTASSRTIVPIVEVIVPVLVVVLLAVLGIVLVIVIVIVLKRRRINGKGIIATDDESNKQPTDRSSELLKVSLKPTNKSSLPENPTDQTPTDQTQVLINPTKETSEGIEESTNKTSEGIKEQFDQEEDEKEAGQNGGVNGAE